MDATVAAAALASRQVQAFCWLRQQTPPCPWDWQVPGSALHGFYGAQVMQTPGDALKHLIQAMEGFPHENSQRIVNDLLVELPPARRDATILAAVAGAGELAMLQLLRSQNSPYPWDATACAAAAEAGHLQVLMYLRSHSPPCPWDAESCRKACFYDRLDILRWLRGQGCPWTSACCEETLQRTQPDNATAAAKQTFAWLRSQDPPCPWSPECCLLSSKSGLVALLKKPCGGSPRVWTREDCRRASQQSLEEVLADLAQANWKSVSCPASPALKKLVLYYIDKLKRADELGLSTYLVGWLRSRPDLCALVTARRQLDVLKWLFHIPSQQQHASQQLSIALQTAAHLQQLHTVQFLLHTLQHPLTQAEASMESWYVVTKLVRWARRQEPSDSTSSQDSGNQLGQQGPIRGLLRMLADLEPVLVQQIASDALLYPIEARHDA